MVLDREHWRQMAHSLVKIVLPQTHRGSPFSYSSPVAPKIVDKPQLVARSRRRSVRGNKSNCQIPHAVIVLDSKTWRNPILCADL